MEFVTQFRLKDRRLDFTLISVRTVNSYQQFQMVIEFLIFAAIAVVLL